VAFPYPSEGLGIDELREKLRSELLDEARRAVRARLASLQQEWAEDLRSERIEELIALEGIAAETILLEAERAAVDMILVFNRRRGPLRRLLLGSVTQQVGISTQSPLGEGTSAVFEDVSLTKVSISDFRLGF
jgi:nucleotide-binding universal stress UspA family protein